jgi:putative membrane protein
MIIEKQISFLRLIRLIWRELLCILVVSALPVILLIFFDLGDYAINASIPMVIGTAIAIFLGFRTNSAYERWWEARKLWGSIGAESRNLVRQCRSAIGSNAPEDNEADKTVIQRICYRQIAWLRLLNARLKELPVDTDENVRLLGEAASGEILNAKDPLLAILNRQSEEARDCFRSKRIESQQFMMIEETIGRLVDRYGGCQRIKSTVFPVHYTFFTRVFIWIFIGFLACSLPSNENANYSLIPAIFLIGWVFFMVEGIGSYMQDPFENNRNVIPMDAMSRAIEIDLRECIGETDLPEPIKPIDGALY